MVLNALATHRNCSKYVSLYGSNYFIHLFIKDYLKHSPLKSRRQNQINSEIPFDCRCKSYLHPTASTFDILPGDDGTALPHVVTLLDSKSIHYRPSLRVPLCGYESFSVQTDVDYNENGGNQSLANQVRGIKIDE